MYAELMVDRPVADLLGDWDILDDLVSKKFSRFQRVGDGILVVRRRMLEGNQVVDPAQGDLADNRSSSGRTASTPSGTTS